jgi:hypothetical protein
LKRFVTREATLECAEERGCVEDQPQRVRFEGRLDIIHTFNSAKCCDWSCGHSRDPVFANKSEVSANESLVFPESELDQNPVQPISSWQCPQKFDKSHW